jgi:acetate kinase
MGSRSGDLDPGLFSYPARTEQMSAAQSEKMVNQESGNSARRRPVPTLRDLLDRETQDLRASEAITLFCYQARKRIDAFAAALGGLDTLAPAGGIGENAPRSGADLRRFRLSRHRTEPGAQCEECAAGVVGDRPRQAAGHPHRRGG